LDKSLSVIIQRKDTTDQYFPEVLFIVLYEVVLTFWFVNEILKFDHSNKTQLGWLSFGAVYFQCLQTLVSDFTPVSCPKDKKCWSFARLFHVLLML